MDQLPFYLLFVINLVILYIWHDEKQQFTKDRKDAAAERKDLYDRLMARNFDQYKDREGLEENQLETVVDPEDPITDLADARDEIEANG